MLPASPTRVSIRGMKILEKGSLFRMASETSFIISWAGRGRGRKERQEERRRATEEQKRRREAARAEKKRLREQAEAG